MSTEHLRVMALTLLFLAGACAAPGEAKVFLSREEALQTAFPGASESKARDFFLTPAQIETVRRLSGLEPESGLVTLYEARKDGAVLGHAVFDTQVVRTMPETLMVVVSPRGEVIKAVMCAFHEPPEYLPTDGWFRQLDGKSLGASLLPGRDVAAVTGSTLSTRAVTAGVRRALALVDVCISHPAVGD